MLPDKNAPIVFDACSIMIGVGINDPNYKFDKIEDLILKSVFEYFTDIRIHEVVYSELDQEHKAFVDRYIGVNVTIVSENQDDLSNASYLLAFNQIAESEYVGYVRSKKPGHYGRNAGEVYSIAYAVEHKIRYFSTRDYGAVEAIMTSSTCRELTVIPFETVLLIAYISDVNSNKLKEEKKQRLKALKSIYKSMCANTRFGVELPKTFSEYIREVFNAEELKINHKESN